MKKQLQQNCKSWPSFALMFMMFVMFLAPQTVLNAQTNVTITLGENSRVVIMGDSVTFNVGLVADATINTGVLQVEVPAGFALLETTPGFIAGSLSPDGRTGRVARPLNNLVPVTHSVFVRGLCDAATAEPIVANRVVRFSYFPNDVEAAPLAEAQTAPIQNFSNPLLLTTFTAGSQTVTTNVETIGNRIIQIQQTLDGAHVNAIQVTAAVSNSAIFTIHRIEGSRNAGGPWVPLPNVVITDIAGGFQYIVTRENAFSVIGGYAGNNLGWGESLFLREVVTISQYSNTVNIDYTFAIGDGVNFCAIQTLANGRLTYVSTPPLPGPTTTPVFTNISRTNPTSPTNHGVFVREIQNNSHQTGTIPANADTARLLGIRTREAISIGSAAAARSLTVTSAAVGNATYMRYIGGNRGAFLINPNGTAAGPVVAGVVDTIWIPMTNVSTVAGNEIWEVDFRQLTNPALAAYYEAAGLRDYYGVGRWADVLRGGRVRYGIIWNVNFDRLTDPGHPAHVACGPATGPTSPAALMPDASESSRLFFTNFHGTSIDHQGTAARVAPTTNSATTFRQTGTWGYNAITNPRILPLNFGPTTPGTLTFNVTATTTTGASFLSAAASIGATGTSDLWVTITLPADMHFNSTATPALVVAGATVPLASIEIVNPRTVRFRRTTPAAYTVSIAVVANGTIIPENQRRVEVSHELDYGRTGAVMPRFGCLTSPEIEYVVLTAPCTRFTWVGMLEEGRGFYVERTSFGYTDITRTTRVTDVEDARSRGFNLRALDAHDNFTLRAHIRAVNNTSITPTEELRLAVTWRADQNFFGAEPGRPQGASLYINDSPTGIDIAPASVSWTTTGVSVNIAPYLRNNGHINLQANDSIRLEVYGRTNATASRVHVTDPVLRLMLYEGSIPSCGPRLEQFYVYNSTFNANNASGTTGFVHNVAHNSVVVIDRTTSSGTGTLPILNYRPLLTGGEYRPNVTDWSEIVATFPLLLEINSVRVELTGAAGVIGNQTARTLTATEWSVEYSNGNTILRIYTPPGDIMAELRGHGYRILANARVINYASPGTTVAHTSTVGISRTIDASYTTGHTTENPTTVTLASANFVTNHTPYNVRILSPTPHVVPLGTRAEWTIRVHLQNNWTYIPHSWISVQVPPGVTPVELRRASTNLPVAASFEQYAPNRYWIQIGNVNVSAGANGFEDFILSCSFANCDDTQHLTVRYGMSRVAFPLDPIRGFYQFDSVERIPLGIQTIPISFTPPDLPIHFAGFVNHEPNQAGNTNTFCEPVTFQARFSNALATEVSDLEVRVDLDDFELQGFRFHGTFVPQVRFGSGPWVDAASASVNNRVLSIRLDDSRSLTGFGTANAVAEVRFQLFMTCGIQNGLQIPVTLLGNSPCGETHIERVVTTYQLRIFGLQPPPVYWIQNLSLTIDPMTGGDGASGLMNLRGTFVQAGAAADNVYAIIDLLPNTELEEVIMPSLNFTQNGRRLTASLPNTTAIGSVFEFNLRLRPVNIADWTTDTSYVFIRTGLSNWLECEGMLCQILEIGVEDSVAVSMIKLEVRLSEEISARSRFGSETTERVEIEGWLVNHGDDDAGRLTMELVFFNGVYYEPIQGVVSGLSVAGVPGNDSIRFTIVANVPYFQDVCNMVVLLRKDNMVVGSFNAYLAESSRTFVGNPVYQITLQPEPICQMAVGVPIGDMPIRGYSYVWHPADFLDRDNRTQALFSHNFRDFPFFSDTTLIFEKTIIRPTGCQSMDFVFVQLLAMASVQELEDTTLCSGSPFRFEFYDPNNTSSNPTTFVWTIDNGPSVGLPLMGTQPVIDVASVRNFTTQPIVVNVQVTPRRNGCDGVTESFLITVNPIPALSSPLYMPSVCSGEPINYTARSLTGGATFRWERMANADITPAPGPEVTGNVISETLTNTSELPVTVRYRITTSLGTCESVEYVEVIVSPIPVLSSSLILPDICSGDLFNYMIESNTPGANFTWMRMPNDNIAEPASYGHFMLISEHLTAIGSDPVTVEYRIISEVNGCRNDVGQIVTFTVNPLPQIVITAPSTPIAMGVGNEKEVTATVTGGDPSTFTWTSSNTDFATVVPDAVDPSIATITALTQSIVYITLSVENPTTGCQNSTTFIVNIGSENVAKLNLAAGAQSQVCNLGRTTLELSITGGTPPFTVQYTDGVTNFTLPPVHTSVLRFQVDPPANAGNARETHTYSLVSVIDNNGQVVSVAGTAVEIEVLPVVQITNVAALAGEYCQDEKIITDAFATNVGTSNVNFMWTNSNLTIGLPASGTDNLPAFTARNESFQSINGTIRVTPLYVDQISCPGTPESFVITIHPQPEFTVVDPRPICSGTEIDFVAQQASLIQGLRPLGSTVVFYSDADGANPIVGVVAPTVTTTYYVQATSLHGCVSAIEEILVEVVQTPGIDPVADVSVCDNDVLNITFTGNKQGATYLWSTVSVNPNFIGLPTAGRNSISSTLRNNTDEPQFKTIEVYSEFFASASGLTCIGDTIQFEIRLNPTPRLQGSSWLPAVCSGEPIEHLLESRTQTAAVDITWARQSNPDIFETPGFGASVIAEVNGLTSRAHDIAIVTYRVELSIDGCSNVEYLNMQVLPVPNVSNAVLEERVCSGERSSPVRLTSDVWGTQFEWTATASSSDITGFTASGQGNIPAQTLFNTGQSEGTVIYTIVPELGHCSGDAVEFVIQVDPLLRITALSEDVNICSGDSVTLSVEAIGSDLTFQWYRNDRPISNARNSEFAITNAAANAGDEYFVIVSGSCGVEQSETIIVRVNLGGRIVVRWDDVILVDNEQGDIVGFQWYRNGVRISGATGQWFHQPGGLDGTYSARLTMADGSIMFTCDETFVLTQAPSPASLEVSPNPVEAGRQVNAVLLDRENNDPVRGFLYTVQGMRVREFTTHDSEILIDTHNLSAGIYILRVITADGNVHTERVVVQR
ncbi:MAG: T9SS type A sorting domain-containing protein [Bacteroidales bacterium]|nr:T9SS type A sorting domain-containing protein [Bacteroidales bacterium]